MDLRQLRYFAKVVELGNVTRASEALHIAQPAVSQQMRALERDLGMQLLTRSVHGVMPTPAGRTLYRHALGLLMEADRTRELLRQDAEEPAGRVSVAMPSSTARLMAIPLARRIRDRHPGITLELIEAPTADLPQLVDSGRVALAVMADADRSRSTVVQPLLTEELYLVAWPEFPLEAEVVSLSRLAQMPLVMPSAPNTIRRRVEWALREEGVEWNVLFEASSTALLFAAVLERLGVTILPWSAAYLEIEQRKLKIARVDHNLFARELSLCWKESGLISNAVVKVKTTMLRLFEEYGSRPGWTHAPSN